MLFQKNIDIGKSSVSSKDIDSKDIERSKSNIISEDIQGPRQQEIHSYQPGVGWSSKYLKNIDSGNSQALVPRIATSLYNGMSSVNMVRVSEDKHNG